MNDVSDVICTLLLCKYPSIDAVYEYTVSWTRSSNSGLLIVFFEDDEGIRLETVWKAPIVPKLPLEVFYWQAKLKPKPKTPKTREVFFQNNEASSTSVSRGTY